MYHLDNKELCRSDPVIRPVIRLLASQLKGAGLLIDCITANRCVRHWLAEVANVRVHSGTQARPIDRWREEQDVLMDVSSAHGQTPPARSCAPRPVPVESIQHPLSVYGALLEGVA